MAARRGDEDFLLTSGTTARGGALPVRSDTRFEIGSLTKTFTALLLAEMVARGEVGYDDPVERYLPRECAPRAPITLVRLATHSSGLPKLPPGLWRSALPAWFTNPYRAFTARDVLAAVPRARPRPGVRYSNFGVGLLGHLLARAAGCPFEELLTARVLRPLGLPDTGCAPAPQATGYWRGRPRPPWEIPGLPAAGALRSSARDMLRYLTAHLNPSATPLERALTEVARPRVALPGGADHLCLVWNHRARPGHELLFHSGGTRGFTSFAGFSPRAGTALVALVNTGPTLRGTFIQRSYEALRTLATLAPA
ncbi:CubicO group peptidase (beta-lactamase class C family) [Saccharothrix coeruleofusca]|uniref:serine hydrolase domain-containing protein n=1 Tax=Saccharothrix coeruleofusca TaxID=33919 RepID=UPI001AEAB822|nr:serine hydrolase domain-containing protein [Saccharothrix coeruleofusca]MBP2337591.1 CubicO group peptidase (beta-lactamase class C family) [Saccharothrix coeruleofusca]